MNVLLTGSQGFIGSNVIPRLKLSHPDLEFTTLDKSGGADVEHDLTRPFKWEPPQSIDAVLHLAAMSGVRTCTNDVVDYNTSIARNLTEWATKNKVPTIVHASSSNVYGVIRVMNESYEPRPVSKYGMSKLKAEDTLTEWAKTTGGVAINLRIFNAIGHNQRHNMLPYLIASHLKGEIKLQLFGVRTRGWTYVGDIVKAMGDTLTFFHMAKEGTVLSLNVGTGKTETQHQMIERFERWSGKTAHPEEVVGHPLDLSTTQADIYRFDSVMGWHPSADNIDIGVQEVLTDLKMEMIRHTAE
jgi:nucleoside-diphosphate-sugar epimerase